jgi:hypothetical protein
VDQLKRDIAEMTIRVLALPSITPRDHAVLAEVERMANQVLRQVAALQSQESSSPGEQRGAWRIFKNTG